MLVLSRKRLESIQIGEDIVITVVAICGSKIRIGIEAPRGVPVNRTEVWAAVSGQRIGSVPASSASRL